MGEMASTLAHELNQPLAAISSYNTGCLNMIEHGNLPPDELTGILRKIGKQAQRAGQIIRRVHAFVRRSEPKFEAIDLDAVIREAVGLVEPDAERRGVAIDLDLTDGLPEVLADPVMIEQVAVNLIRNGMDAMAEAPRHERVLTLTTRLQDDMVLQVQMFEQEKRHLEAKRLKDLEAENTRLKKLLAEQLFENDVIKDALRKKC